MAKASFIELSCEVGDGSTSPIVVNPQRIAYLNPSDDSRTVISFGERGDRVYVREDMKKVIEILRERGLL